MARNVVFLIASQAITMAISFGVTVAVARHLGAEDYGIMFFASSFVSVAFIFVEFGQSFFVVSAIARDRNRLAVLFGTGMALRLASSLLVFLPIMGVASLLDYPEKSKAAIAAMVLFNFVNSIAGGFGTVFRGLERMDYEAVGQVGLKVFMGAASIAAVVLGADVIGVIKAQALGTALALTILLLLVRRLRLPRPRVTLEAMRELLRGGIPFLAWSGIVAVHAAVDSIMLSKLAPEEVVGWYGAASKLLLIVSFPAGIVASALYPTLSRLHANDLKAFRQLARSGLRWMLFIGGLAAAGAYLFADQATSVVYGQKDFGRAAEVLKILSGFIFALYLNFVLGTAIMAAEREKPWVYLKAGTVAALMLMNLLLIPLYQREYGNGGIGSAVATASAEILLLLSALFLAPRGILDVGLLRDLGRVVVGIAVMVGVKYLLSGVSVAIGIPSAALAYAVVILASGGVGRGDLAELRAAIRFRSGRSVP